MKVEHHDGLRFWVTSASNPAERYFCDLGANNGVGSCTCRDFETRCAPKIKAGAELIDWPHANRITCKHLTAALMWLARTAVNRAR